MSNQLNQIENARLDSSQATDNVLTNLEKNLAELGQLFESINSESTETCEVVDLFDRLDSLNQSMLTRVVNDTAKETMKIPGKKK